MVRENETLSQGKVKGKSGKSQGILKTSMSGNPDVDNVSSCVCTRGHDCLFSRRSPKARRVGNDTPPRPAGYSVTKADTSTNTRLTTAPVSVTTEIRSAADSRGYPMPPRTKSRSFMCVL